mgnify:CR=1|jgi:hypothetical protein|tara:strand:- start:210 stop:521 length:312 start_codon:yes stop_codon:yes gene_type:complete
MFDENTQEIQNIDGNEQLYSMCKELWSNMSVEEFNETLKEEGWDELYTRCMITRETFKIFEDMLGPDWKSKLKEKLEDDRYTEVIESRKSVYKRHIDFFRNTK